MEPKHCIIPMIKENKAKYISNLPENREFKDSLIIRMKKYLLNNNKVVELLSKYIGKFIRCSYLYLD